MIPRRADAFAGVPGRARQGAGCEQAVRGSLRLAIGVLHQPRRAEVLEARCRPAAGRSRLDKALKLAPKNPRVVLIDALNDYERPRALGGDRQQACTKFERAAQLFDASPQAKAEPPSWGAADAYLYVGRCLNDSGDVLGARNALERALIIAPDFAAARLELRRAVAPKS